MTTLMMRILSVAALAVALFGAQRSFAGAAAGCCVCACDQVATVCEASTSAVDCSSGICLNACMPQFVNSSCAAVAECASAPAAAPSLDANGLAAAIVLLSGLAGLRLRRRAAPRR